MIIYSDQHRMLGSSTADGFSWERLRYSWLWIIGKTVKRALSHSNFLYLNVMKWHYWNQLQLQRIIQTSFLLTFY